MSTPYDPGRPDDRPTDQPGYPSAPPPQDYPQGGGQPGSSHQGFPPAPDSAQQGYGQGSGQGYGQGSSQSGYGQGQPDYGQGSSQPDYGQGRQPDYGQGQPNYGQQGQQPDYGQQPYAGGPNYGNAPAYENAPAYSNQGFGTPPGRPQLTPPSDVLRAVQLMFARVAISVIGAIIAFTSGDAVKDSIRANDPSLSAADVDRAYNIGVGVAVFFGLVFAVLYILLAIQVRKGKNWARIVTFVLAGLGVLGGLLGLFGDGTGLEKGLSIIQLLIDAAIIVLLARKPANEYFTAMKGPRH